MGTILRQKSVVFVYTAMGVLCVEHANVLELCYIELLSGNGSPYSILSSPKIENSNFLSRFQIWPYPEHPRGPVEVCGD